MILAVVSGKGGVGKSTVAYNLAAELDAVCVDADLGMGDLPTRRGPDLHDALAGRASAVEAVDESGPVRLLPCGRTLSGTRAADVRALATALRRVECAYGPVVVDCAAGLGSDVGVPLAAADACVVVTTPDRIAVADALRVRALARALDAGLSRVAVNRAPGPGTAREAFGAPAVAIPESDRLRTAFRHGHPIRSTAPESPAAERLATLARGVYASVRSV